MPTARTPLTKFVAAGRVSRAVKPASYGEERRVRVACQMQLDRSVQIVRHGGEYLAERGREHRTQRAWLLALAALAAVVAGALGHPVAAVAALVGGAIAVLPVQRRLRRVRRGIEGEAVVVELLQRLPDDYFLVNDVPLRGLRGNVDHVLIGPCGVVAIETKRYAGVIACERNRWSANGRRIRNLTRQVNAGALAVKRALAAACPDIRASAASSIDGVVVFTDPLCRLEIDRPGTTVVRLSELLSVIQEKGKRRRLPPDDAASLALGLVRQSEAPTPAGNVVGLAAYQAARLGRAAKVGAAMRPGDAPGRNDAAKVG